MRNRLNKRGSIADVITVLVFPIILISVIVSIFIGYHEFSSAIDDISGTMEVEGFAEASEALGKETTKFHNFWDPLLVFMFVGMWIGIMVVSYILGNSPVFTFLYVIGSFGLIIIAGLLFYVMNFVLTDDVIAPYMIDFPITTFFVQNFWAFGLFAIAGIGLALYMKPSEGGLI